MQVYHDYCSAESTVAQLRVRAHLQIDKYGQSQSFGFSQSGFLPSGAGSGLNSTQTKGLRMRKGWVVEKREYT